MFLDPLGQSDEQKIVQMRVKFSEFSDHQTMPSAPLVPRSVTCVGFFTCAMETALMPCNSTTAVPFSMGRCGLAGVLGGEIR
jgi:hypothetical protein